MILTSHTRKEPENSVER